MTTLTALMLTDPKSNPRKGTWQRLRTHLSGGRRSPDDRTAGQPLNTLLHDVALGGTSASAANSFLKTLATGRRG